MLRCQYSRNQCFQLRTIKSVRQNKYKLCLPCSVSFGSFAFGCFFCSLRGCVAALLSMARFNDTRLSSVDEKTTHEKKNCSQSARFLLSILTYFPFDRVGSMCAVLVYVYYLYWHIDNFV